MNSLVLLSAGESVQDLIEVAVDFFNQAFQLIIDLIELNPSSTWGSAWNHVLTGYRIVQPVGTALLVTFFLLGFIKTTTTYMDVRRPEHVLKALIRFALCAYICIHGAQLLADMVGIGISLTKQIVSQTGLDEYRLSQPVYLTAVLSNLKLTKTPVQAILTLLISFVGMVMIIAAMISIIATLYGRFFKMFMYIALAPIPLSTLGSESTQHMGISYIKNFTGVCLECVSAAIAILVFTVIAPDMLNGIEFHGPTQEISDAYFDEIVEYYSGSEDLVNSYRNGEISYWEFWAQMKSRNGWTDEEIEENFIRASLWDRIREESIIEAYGYHRALIAWLLPVIFSLFLLSTTIKAIDQITARIIGTGG